MLLMLAPRTLPKLHHFPVVYLVDIPCWTDVTSVCNAVTTVRATWPARFCLLSDTSSPMMRAKSVIAMKTNMVPMAIMQATPILSAFEASVVSITTGWVKLSATKQWLILQICTHPSFHKPILFVLDLGTVVIGNYHRTYMYMLLERNG